MGAYVQLLEYNNIEGMILLSELTRRRIRSVTKLIKAMTYLREIIWHLICCVSSMLATILASIALGCGHVFTVVLFTMEQFFCVYSRMK